MTQSPEVLSRLDALAVKLGVAADHLWGVLVRQAYVEAVTAALFLGIVGLATYLFYRAVKYGRAQEWYERYDSELAWLGTGIVGIALLITWIIALVQIVCGVGYLLNPEYFALSQILGALK